MSVGADPRPVRPSTSTNNNHVERVRAVIVGSRRRVVADVVGISIGSCYHMFIEKLQMRHVSAKFVPRLLTDDHLHPQLSGKTSDVRCAPATLFSGLSPSRRLPVSQT
jgi:hypothetical protein